MNLDAVVAKGRLPWKPRPDARDVDVWHQDEHPHVGTFTWDVGTVAWSICSTRTESMFGACFLSL
jgi:hypothetical protein